MLVCLAFCAKDKHIAVRLAEWIRELGGVKRHKFLLGVNKDTNSDGVIGPLRDAFDSATEVRLDVDETRYPHAANEMWKAFVWGVRDLPEKQSWLWMEPDAVPLTPDWLDRIEVEYKACGKPFMADEVRTPTSLHHSGVGVYPADVLRFTTRLHECTNSPWDVFLKEDFGPQTHDTKLIHDKFYQEWGKHESGHPVFPDAASLHALEPGAVLYHRAKENDLIPLLRERLAVPASAQREGRVLPSVPEPQSSPNWMIDFEGSLKGMVRDAAQEAIRRIAALEQRISVLEHASSRITTAPANYTPFAERHVPSDGELERLQENLLKKQRKLERGMRLEGPTIAKKIAEEIGAIPSEPKKHGQGMKRKGRKPMSPEHKAKVVAALAGARAKKASKLQPA